MKRSKTDLKSSDLQSSDQMLNAETDLSSKVTGKGMVNKEVLTESALDVETVSKMLKETKKTGKPKQISDDEEEHILAIIPCYNEEATIGSVIVKTRKYVDEVVVVDDGSTDDTVKIVASSL